jgi:hypothetical protein
MASTTTKDGLDSTEKLRKLGMMLSDAADAFNQRLRAEAATLTNGERFARLQEEQMLRMKANQLFFEASRLTIQDALNDQAELEAVLTKAQTKIAQFQQFQDTLDLVADLLSLGGAIISGRPSVIFAALKEVRKDVMAAS